MPRGAPGAVVLLSGGMDSATCLAVAARETRPIDALTVYYGQRHERELRSARALARHFGVRRHVVLRLPLAPLLRSNLTDPSKRPPRPGTPGAPPRIPATYVPARNTILLSIALGYAESFGLGRIYLGVNAVDYSGYPDCRPEFLAAYRKVARLATKVGVEAHRPIDVQAPLQNRSKAEIVRLGTRLGVPWGLTWSCYAAGPRPCGRCDACRLRANGFRAAGEIDPSVTRGPSASPTKRRRRTSSPSR